MHFTLEFLLSGSKSIPGRQRLHQVGEEEGAVGGDGWVGFHLTLWIPDLKT